MNELIYQQGGTLVLDETWPSPPSVATITIRTLGNVALSSVSGLSDIEDEDCDLDDLVITLPASNTGARLFEPTETVGTIGDLTDPTYKMLLLRGGRKHYVKVSEYDSDTVNVNSIRFDAPVPFAISEGDQVFGLRVSYPVDWSAGTSTFVGQVKAIWSVTVNGVVHKRTKIYDVVKQTLGQPATWADVLALRPDAETQLGRIPNKEDLVTKAWDNIKQDLYTLGIRHNLIIADGSTTLRDAVVLQTLYNLTSHMGLNVPPSFAGLGSEYLDRLSRDKERALSLLQMPVDENEDEIIGAKETGINRRTVFFRSAYNHRQQS